MKLHNEIIINRRGENLVDLQNFNLIFKRGLALSVESEGRTGSIRPTYVKKKDFQLIPKIRSLRLRVIGVMTRWTVAPLKACLCTICTLLIQSFLNIMQRMLTSMLIG